MICTIITLFNILYIINTALNKTTVNKPSTFENIHLIIIKTGTPTVDELLVLPTTEQIRLSNNCLKPTVTFHHYPPINSNNLASSQTIPNITVEFRQPTVDELLTYPTIEQFQHKHKILKPVTF
ncbi:hypothetical protein CEXT_684931 [Caerostris extrusa]|uniref:Uncharacterized protein n=1 Tax=Caerostris extrusa TaxID=172846 RepID=A0AAV4Y7Z8_CAEEX|nr:hypothetical protein CEXT_684931 [Caerostris extrusa]